MEKYIDTHAHYTSNKFNKERDSILTESTSYCKNIIDLGTNYSSNQKVINLIEKYSHIYGMIGFFPTDSWEIDPEFSNNADTILNHFLLHLNNPKIIGIGEIGLDYHWNSFGNDSNKITGVKAREKQQEWFLYQLNLAQKHNLPVSMHSREAEMDTIKIFNKFNQISGVMHCFSYGWTSAKMYLDKGLYLGIGGTSTYKANAELCKVIEKTPLNRILLETDAPYLSPEPVRREINTSKNIKYVINNIAKIKKISEDQVVKQTNENAQKLFKL